MRSAECGVRSAECGVRNSEFRVQSSEFRTQSSEFRVQPGLDNQVLPRCRPFWNLLEACLYFVRLDLTRSKGGHGRAQFRVQNGLWRGSQFRGGTIQRSEFRGWLWRRTGKRVSSESRVQNSTCLPVGLRGVKMGENPEFRVQIGCIARGGEKGVGGVHFPTFQKGVSES